MNKFKPTKVDNKVYYKFYELENNNYYLLNMDGKYFLGIESVFKYNKGKRQKHFLQGFKVLAIQSFLVHLFLEYINLQKIGEKKQDWGLEPEPVFEQLDVKKVRESLRKVSDEFNKAMKKEFLAPVDYRKSPHSQAILDFIGETNTQLLCMEVMGAYARQFNVAKTLETGELLLHIVKAQGSPEKEKIVSVDTFLFNQDIIRGLLDVLVYTGKVELVKKESEKGGS